MRDGRRPSRVGGCPASLTLRVTEAIGTTQMAFFVYGRDVPDFAGDSDALDEAHWAYMDRWASQLVARGPTLSSDGSTHTGSVHIVDLLDGVQARRFAFEEPYYRAGLYEEITVRPFAPLVEGTMWDRPALSAEQPATFVFATWTETGFGRDVALELRNAFTGTGGARWVFAGALMSDDSTKASGVAAAVDLGPSEAEELMRRAIAKVPSSSFNVDLHRWRRGGRPVE